MQKLLHQVYIKYPIAWESFTLQCWLGKCWPINKSSGQAAPDLAHVLKVSFHNNTPFLAQQCSGQAHLCCLFFKNKIGPSPNPRIHNARFRSWRACRHMGLGRAATGLYFAALQCTMNFCSFTGCSLSDPVTVPNMIWFLGDEGCCFFFSLFFFFPG